MFDHDPTLLKQDPAPPAMRTAKPFIVAACAAVLISSLPAQDANSDLKQQRQRIAITVTKTATLDYLLYQPKDYDAKGDKKWPLILFLHGAGERGTDLAKVTIHGPPKLVKQGKEFPFIIVSPQCPENQRWDSAALLALLDDLIAKHKVDASRVYVTGLSMGGYGSWSLGMLHPEKFAAIAPICGGGSTIDVKLSNRQKANPLKTLGVWAFHGGKDSVVPVAESERMINELKKAGCADVKLTVYPEANHDSWTATYDNPELYDWFLQHKR